MALLTYLVGVGAVLWVTVYTASFGWWLWKKKERLGAAGVFVLAIASVLTPLLVLWRLSR